jgi:RNA polymerase sigma-70 factor (ECF subfamily)
METTLTAMTQLPPRDKLQANESGKPLAEKLGIDWQKELAEHERWLRTVIYTRIGEPQAVDEVFQEVSLAAVRQKAPISDAAKVAAWLYRLAVTQTLLYRRKQGRRRKLIDRYAQRTQPSEGDNRQPEPLGWLLSEERREKVRLAMQRLPRRDAEILLLKYTEDWSYRELAQRLGVSESAVEARLHRARGRLRSELTALDVVANDT